MAKKETKKETGFDYEAWSDSLEINKYLLIGFQASLTEKPKTKSKAEKLLKEYLGE